MSLQDRINKIRISSQSCQRLESKCLKLYKNFKRHEIACELHQTVPFNDSLSVKKVN